MLNCNTFYISPDLRIIRQEGWFGSDFEKVKGTKKFNREFSNFIHDKTTYIFHQEKGPALYGNYKHWYLGRLVASADELGLPHKQVIIECPEPAIKDFVESNSDLGTIVFNHNSMLDPRLYTISTHKNFDAIINSRPVLFKNLHLSNGVENLAFIKGPGSEYDYMHREYSFMNPVPDLGPKKVSELCAQSHCGLILSYAEGSCYSSTEYLLSGIPVVSMQSVGGRDIWYDDYNSIVIDPADKTDAELTDEVSSAVSIMKEKNLDPEIIRTNAIKLQQEQLSTFKDKLQSIFDKHNEEVDAAELFERQFFQKFFYTPWDGPMQLPDIKRQLDDVEYTHIRERQKAYGY